VDAAAMDCTLIELHWLQNYTQVASEKWLWQLQLLLNVATASRRVGMQ